MLGKWNTSYVKFADGRYRICSNPEVLIVSMKWDKSTHKPSGPTSVDAAFVTARNILRCGKGVEIVTIKDYAGKEYVLFSC
jgi:hypothetical protein